ncbi:MAG: SRPBCC family protein [Acidimicrobiales bacterium]
MGTDAHEIPRTFRSGPGDPMSLADQPGTWVEIDIAAPPETVWSLVTDIELPARFSDEFLGASWDGDGPGPEASFVGRSRHEAIGEWEVRSFVEVHEPLRAYGWATLDLVWPGSRWRFDLEPTEGGTRLRYSMSMGPAPSGISIAIEAMPEKEPRILHRRIGEHHANMARTVEGIRKLAEAQP